MSFPCTSCKWPLFFPVSFLACAHQKDLRDPSSSWWAESNCPVVGQPCFSHFPRGFLPYHFPGSTFLKVSWIRKLNNTYMLRAGLWQCLETNSPAMPPLLSAPPDQSPWAASATCRSSQEGALQHSAIGPSTVPPDVSNWIMHYLGG